MIKLLRVRIIEKLNPTNIHMTAASVQRTCYAHYWPTLLRRTHKSNKVHIYINTHNTVKKSVGCMCDTCEL